jgi:hypothetical protein
MRPLILLCATAAFIMTPVAASAELYTDSFLGTVSSGNFAGDAASLNFTYEYPASGASFTNNGTQSAEEATLNPVINAIFQVNGQSFSIVGDQFGEISRQLPNAVVDLVRSQSGALASANLFSPFGNIVPSTDLTTSFDYVVMPGDTADISVEYGNGLGSSFRASEVSGGAPVSPTPEMPAWIAIPASLLAIGTLAYRRKRSARRLQPIPG